MVSKATELLFRLNIFRTRMNRYMGGVRRWFNPTPLPEDNRPETRVVRFPHTPCGCGSLLRNPEENESNENSAVHMQFQVTHIISYSSTAHVLSLLGGFGNSLCSFFLCTWKFQISNRYEMVTLLVNEENDRYRYP